MLQLEFRLVQPDDRRMGLSVRPQVGSLAASHFVRADRAIVEWYKLRGRALAPALPPHVEQAAPRSEEAEAR
jgi:hypothetical protein